MRVTVSVPQLIAIIALVVVLVFIATYVSFTVGGGAPAAPVAVLPAVELLEFVERKPTGPPIESEVNHPGHYDFWFENKKDEPAQIKLNSVGCKCTTVEMVLLPEEARGEPKKQLDARATSGLAWKEMIRDGSKSLTVPAKAVGGIRVNWKSEKVGPDLMKAELIIESRAGLQGAMLEVPVASVEAIRIAAEDPAHDSLHGPNEANLGTILAGESKTASFLAWSSLRKFDLRVISPANPCVTCSEPAKLSEEECKTLADAQSSKVVCAYRFTVTVSEQGKNGRPADLGYFRQGVVIESADAKAEVLVSGLVRGDITIGATTDRNVFNLEGFNSADGAEKTLTLLSDRSDLKLVVASEADLGDRKDPSFPYPEFLAPPVLKNLKPEVGGAWQLTVRVPANAHTGPLPRDSAVYLKIEGDKPRFIRIPIVGNAYVK